MKTIAITIFIIIFSVSPSFGAISKQEFREVIHIIRNEFSHLSESKKRNLKFYTAFENDWAQAFARRWEDDEVHIYGGFARLKEATKDSFALIVCHELGHLYGGYPYSNEDLELSVEGKSDYWATRECMPKILGKIQINYHVNLNNEICNDEILCSRIINASLIVTKHFSVNSKEITPSLNKKEILKVDKILKTHPTAQCRLDTFVSGILKDYYPTCWMKY